MTGIGLFGAALGCQHIGGKNDCGAHPSDAVIAAPSNPYHYAPAGTALPAKRPGNESGLLPEADPLPAFKVVPSGDN
jgi:hypothetical protein